MKLQKIAMVTPTRECIYAPSRITGDKEISEAEFVEKYADYGKSIQVSFEIDGKSNPQQVTAYSNGLDCWWIVK